MSMKAAAGGSRASSVSAEIIPFPQREHRFDSPCADPATCGSVFEIVSAGTRAVVCTRCGKAAVIDAALEELDAAIAASEASNA